MVALIELHKEAPHKVSDNREKQRSAANRGQLPGCSVGDYVVVGARVHRLGGGHRGTVRRLQGPKYYLERGNDVHVARVRLYSDSKLEVTVKLKDGFQHSFTQGEFDMGAPMNIGQAHDGSGYVVRVRWSGFKEGEDK